MPNKKITFKKNNKKIIIYNDCPFEYMIENQLFNLVVNVYGQRDRCVFLNYAYL